MYYRRKIILSLLQVFGGELEKIQLQKLLFLFTRFQKDKKSFDFVPYKFGCFSFQANADLSTLKKYGIVSDTDKFWKKEVKKNPVIEENIVDDIVIENEVISKEPLNAMNEEEKEKTHNQIKDQESTIEHKKSTIEDDLTKYLKEQNANIQIVGCQPTDGSKIPGIRKWPEAYLPTIFNKSRVDRVIEIDEKDAEKLNALDAELNEYLAYYFKRPIAEVVAEKAETEVLDETDY